MAEASGGQPKGADPALSSTDPDFLWFLLSQADFTVWDQHLSVYDGWLSSYTASDWLEPWATLEMARQPPEMALAFEYFSKKYKPAPRCHDVKLRLGIPGFGFRLIVMCVVFRGFG